MKRKWVKFNDLKNSEKAFRIVNLCFIVLILAFCIGFGSYYITIGDPDNRVLSCFILILPVLLPLIYELAFGRRLSNFVVLIYEIYVLLGGSASVVNVYAFVPFYDKIIHFIAGYVFALLGLFFLSRIANYKKLNVWTVAIFCFLFTLMIEYVWELIERFSDLFLGQTSQGDVIPGYNAPLVTDTITDMLCNFGGGLLFTLHFLIGKLSKCSLGVNFIEKEFCYIREDDVKDLAEASIEKIDPEIDDNIERNEEDEIPEKQKSSKKTTKNE